LHALTDAGGLPGVRSPSSPPLTYHGFHGRELTAALGARWVSAPLQLLACAASLLLPETPFACYSGALWPPWRSDFDVDFVFLSGLPLSAVRRFEVARAPTACPSRRTLGVGLGGSDKGCWEPYPSDHYAVVVTLDGR
jgi:hypothetical protein